MNINLNLVIKLNGNCFRKCAKSPIIQDFSRLMLMKKKILHQIPTLASKEPKWVGNRCHSNDDPNGVRESKSAHGILGKFFRKLPNSPIILDFSGLMSMKKIFLIEIHYRYLRDLNGKELEIPVQ